MFVCDPVICVSTLTGTYKSVHSPALRCVLQCVCVCTCACTWVQCPCLGLFLDNVLLLCSSPIISCFKEMPLSEMSQGKQLPQRELHKQSSQNKSQDKLILEESLVVHGIYLVLISTAMLFYIFTLPSFPFHRSHLPSAHTQPLSVGLLLFSQKSDVVTPYTNGQQNGIF